MTENAEEKIRVLIVDDIPETRENLRKLLYFENDIEVVGAAISGEEGIQMAKELQPHIVLMDINMPGVDGITASEAISQEVPMAQVIMMSVQGEADYLRRSMLAGAREFLIKPFSSDELVSSIRRVYELGAVQRARYQAPAPPVSATAQRQPPPPEELGKVISVFSPKGGTGCTTIATNLAIALQMETEARVVLVDGSLQFGDIAVLLNLKPIRTIVDLVPHISELDGDLVNSVIVPHPSGIKTLLAPPRPEMADLVVPDHMKKILEELKKSFDCIVVDTWTSLHDLVLTIMDVSDRIVLITTPDIPSIKNTKLFFEVTEALGYPPEKVLLTVNKVDRRSSIRAEDIEAGIKHPVAATLALDERVATIAANQGAPFILSAANSPIAQSVVNLAHQLLETLIEEEEVAETTAASAGEKLVHRFRFSR
ncbi:MAG TPA: response regulator [Anaerolineae bacterium]|nr:response regulator [Anaerolineae bacterium]